MSRAITVPQQGEVVKRVTRPLFFVELGFSTTLRLSSGSANSTWNSQTWAVSGLRVPDVRPIGQGGASARIQLPDFDGGYFTVIRSEGVDDKTAKIWLVYGDPGDTFAANDPVQVFDGSMDEVEDLAEIVTLSCKTASTRTQTTPRHYVDTPVFNHLPADGEKINFYGVEWTAERAP